LAISLFFSFTIFLFYRLPRLLELEDRLLRLLEELLPDDREAELSEVTCPEDERLTEFELDRLLLLLRLMLEVLLVVLVLFELDCTRVWVRVLEARLT
jgi:hypothetical protein